MKDHYDFTKAEQGKFYRPLEELKAPVYLDPEVQKDLLELMGPDQTDFQAYVNTLLKKDIELFRAMQTSKS